MGSQTITILSKNNSTGIQQADVFTAPTIWQLEKTGGHTKREIKVAICAIVNAKLKNFNFSLPMTTDQVIVFAEEFVDLYYTDTLEDLVMMFRYVVGGRIGKRFNTADPRTLFEWYREYLDIKLQEKERILKQQKREEDSEPKEAPPELKQLIDKYTEKEPLQEGNAMTHEAFMETVDGLPLHKLKNLLKQLQNGAVYDAFEKDIEKVEKLIESKTPKQ